MDGDHHPPAVDKHEALTVVEAQHAETQVADNVVELEADLFLWSGLVRIKGNAG